MDFVFFCFLITFTTFSYSSFVLFSYTIIDLPVNSFMSIVFDLIMVLPTKELWVNFFTSIPIPPTQSSEYTNANHITEDNLHEFQQSHLQVGITALGNLKNILRKTKNLQPLVPVTTQSTPDSTDNVPSASFMKRSAAKLPQLNAGKTHPQFWKFKTDWHVFKYITNILDSKIHAQLYSCCDYDVQKSLANTITDFFTLTEDQLLTTIE